MRVKQCVICNKEFRTKSYMKKTCSTECSNKRAKLKADEWKENNPSYHKEYMRDQRKK